MSRKNIIITIIIIVVVIIIIAMDILLYLNYRAQKEQEKIAADIQTAQEIVEQGRVEEVSIEQLESQGFAEEAIEILEEEIQRIEESQPIIITEDEFIIEIDNILEEYSVLDFDSKDKVVANLENLSPTIISDLEGATKTEIIESRYNAHFALMLLGENSEASRIQIQPIMENGLNDSAPHISGIIANFLIYYGDKQAIPILIEKLDPNYNDVYMLSEPPLPLPTYALKTLKRYTGQNFDKNVEQWQNWWEQNNEGLTWDDQKRIFILK